MSLNNGNNIISESSPDIMEYLIQKLESRQRNLFNYANLFNSINSIEDFYLKRKNIFNLFQNLEEELRQASLAIKALMVQNKALSEENMKCLNIRKNNTKLVKENNYLLKENNNLTQKLKEIDILNINEKRPKSPSFNKDYQKYKLNEKSFNNKKYKTNDNFSGNKSSYNKKNFNKTKNNNKLNNNRNVQVNESYDDDINGLKNVKAIMEGMKKNKMKLKEVVNEHFVKNYIE